MKYHITKKSSNEKTGPIVVTTTAEPSCAASCPLKHDGCYAEQGKLALHWRKVTEGQRGVEFSEFVSTLTETIQPNKLWRHNQAGDLPGIGDTINSRQAMAIALANSKVGARGFTYTHKPVTGRKNSRNLQTVRAMVAAGFAVNLSANNLSHADKLAALGLPVAAIVPIDTNGAKLTTPKGRPVVVCPAQRIQGVTCEKCGLCASLHPKRPIVGFMAHGPGKAKANVHACKGGSI